VQLRDDNLGNALWHAENRGGCPAASIRVSTLTAQGYLIFDLMAGRNFGKLDLDLTLHNLLDADRRGAQFAEESRVAGWSSKCTSRRESR
jgi:hypothetical protein